MTSKGWFHLKTRCSLYFQVKIYVTTAWHQAVRSNIEFGTFEIHSSNHWTTCKPNAIYIIKNPTMWCSELNLCILHQEHSKKIVKQKFTLSKMFSSFSFLCSNYCNITKLCKTIQKTNREKFEISLFWIWILILSYLPSLRMKGWNMYNITENIFM